MTDPTQPRYQLRSGYAYTTETEQPWRAVPNDAWEHALVDDDAAGAHPFVGVRLIDGHPCAVFRAEDRYLAQLVHYASTGVQS